MHHLPGTPNISVTIGRHTRQYFAYVTTAPAALDSPATLTLQHGPVREVITMAADPFPNEGLERRTTARLVLVDAMELAWQRAKCRGQQHRLLRADPSLVALNTLQHWLWQRLQAPTNSSVIA